ncbi:MAG: type II toxin-antitoxin system RelE/ParE family toxin [Synergistaceae bacterium]|nr:type II toxin-antitoxin system RelE/ParE family toxin [Synergistaceae bacterium]
MREIIFYQDRHGNQPVLDYIQELEKRKDKDSHIKLDKILKYIDMLLQKGKLAGEPYIKHIEGEIWELRPIKDRIFFATWNEDKFIMLHHFIKKTQKTPPEEIDHAKRALADFRRRVKK